MWRVLIQSCLCGRHYCIYKIGYLPREEFYMEGKMERGIYISTVRMSIGKQK